MKTVKLLTVKFSPFSSYFLPLMPKYLPQFHVHENILCSSLNVTDRKFRCHIKNSNKFMNLSDWMFTFLIAAVIKLTNVTIMKWCPCTGTVLSSSDVKVSYFGFHRSSVTTRNWQPWLRVFCFKRTGQKMLVYRFWVFFSIVKEEFIFI